MRRWGFIEFARLHWGRVWNRRNLTKLLRQAAKRRDADEVERLMGELERLKEEAFRTHRR